MNRSFKLILIIFMLLAVIGASACIGEEKEGTAKGSVSGEGSQGLVVGIGTDVNN